MFREPPSQDITGRTLTASPWERVAFTLKNDRANIDDVARARMERNLVEAWRARGARAIAMPSMRPHFSRSTWVLSLAASAAFGALCALYVLHTRDTVASIPAEIPARFDLVIDDGSVQSGFLTEGQVLESGQHGHVEVALEQSRVDMAPDSRVRFERLGRDELRLSLMKGRVEVAFHPERRGQQHMSIETRSARVLVVGTQFAVDAEGVVQVVPRSEGETQFVHAGQQISVPVQAPSERERAVREGIETHLREDSAPSAKANPVEAADASLTDTRSQVGHRQHCAQEAGVDTRLEAARALLLQGRHSAARERLLKLAKKETLPTSTRVEALVLTAESYTAQGQIARATETYRDAVNIAPHHPAGYNALFALARLSERYTDDRSAAGAVYREYLERAPKGALAAQAREALCRLGDAASCD
jgi:TolA-binding protein